MISEFVDPVLALDDEVVKPSGLEYVFGVSMRKGTPMLRVEMAKAAFVYWKHDGVRRQQRKTWLAASDAEGHYIAFRSSGEHERH